MIGMGSGPSESQCSRAGCRELATSTVNWRNPRIHTDDRVKVWLACDEHTPYLQEYLANRGFPVVVAGLDARIDRVPAS